MIVTHLGLGGAGQYVLPFPDRADLRDDTETAQARSLSGSHEYALTTDTLREVWSFGWDLISQEELELITALGALDLLSFTDPLGRQVTGKFVDLKPGVSSASTDSSGRASRSADLEVHLFTEVSPLFVPSFSFPARVDGEWRVFGRSGELLVTPEITVTGGLSAPLGTLSNLGPVELDPNQNWDRRARDGPPDAAPPTTSAFFSPALMPAMQGSFYAVIRTSGHTTDLPPVGGQENP